jgi:hypothetical protein
MRTSMMRAVVLALAVAGLAGGANAQMSTGSWGGGVQHQVSPTVPAGALKQAEEAVRQAHGNPPGAAFRTVKAIEVATVKQSAFANPIDGPASVVCGQYTSGDPASADYFWFFVAIKHGKVLWITSDTPSNSPGDAYYSCQSAGLAD